MPSRRRNTVDPLQLAAGDFVVHEQHGVGRYVEMTQRTVGGATREYLVLEYAASKRGQPPDRLYVPTDQLDQVTRYVGGEAAERAPARRRRLAADEDPRAQGGAPDRRRARQALRGAPAGGRLRLLPRHPVAARARGRLPLQRDPGPGLVDRRGQGRHGAADPDGPAGLRRRRLRQDRDRRARGVQGGAGRQAGRRPRADHAARPAALPDVLATATRGFPVKVAALSRFQTDKEAKAVLDGLADGAIDVVIGTHRLFSSQTRFKDLGLLIVDEEQRFGVEHKEHIKALRTNVDVLTMSATPIPRTLEMAVTGIREMSTIQTPPEERHPVLTYVGAYDDKQIAAAIRRELLRDGQVFFVHNRVESIERVAARLRDLVPEARIAVAHGQMNEHALEQIIVDFWEKQLRRPGLHHDRRDRPRHPQRQHADRRPRRHVRPAPAAPAARPGGPRPRARLRLLPLPAGEAADARPRTTGWPRSPPTPTSARAWPWR